MTGALLKMLAVILNKRNGGALASKMDGCHVLCSAILYASGSQVRILIQSAGITSPSLEEDLSRNPTLPVTRVNGRRLVKSSRAWSCQRSKDAWEGKSRKFFGN